jgi:hypothetical protein
MIPPSAFPTSIDKDAERRRALAKVYELLLKLADENESKETTQDKPALLKSNIPPTK